MRTSACAPLVRALGVLLVLTALHQAQARFEWRDVVQDVRILADGGVEVRDERTLWTTEDFAEAFVCVRLRAGETLTLLPGETGAISPGPAAEGRTQSCTGGTEVYVRQDARVRERRVRFAYRLDGVVDVYSDVVQWYWNILERASDRPVVVGYRLRVTAPGPMTEPYDAFVMRYANPELPTVALSADRSVLDVSFRRIPPNDGVEIRYLMDPALFDERGDRAGLEGLLRDQLRIVRDDDRTRFWRALRSHPVWALLPAAGVAYLVMGILGAYRRVGREPAVEAMRYPFEPPRDVVPAAVATVMQQDVPATSLGPAWFATIMDLARRGFLRFEGEGRSLVIHLESEPSGDTLESFERAVLTYLGNAARSGRSGRRDPTSVTIAELSTYGQSNAQRFLASFGRQVKAWAEGYYGGPYLTPESLAARNHWTLRSLLVGLAIGVVIYATTGLAMALSIAAAAACLVLLIAASITLPAWTPEMAREHAAWKGFRRTLTDYTRMKDAPPDFFMLWDRYYVYAAALGVAERYLRTLQRAAPAAGMDQRSMATRGAWLGVANARDLGQMSRSISGLSSALARSGASASSGGSSSGGGGGGGGGSSGGR
jgi:uncharacterized membrane protein